MMGRVIVDYECPRCGYTTNEKWMMRRHLYGRKGSCQAKLAHVGVVELTDAIKEEVLANRIMHHDKPLPQTAPAKAKRTTIPKKVRMEAWDRYIGMDIGKALCMCCEKEDMTQMTFHCGHVISHADGGGMHINNLRPICASCNLSMRTQNMNEFRQQFFGLGEVRGAVEIQDTFSEI